MRAEVVAGLLVHHALEHRAEDCGGYLRPVERGAVEKGAAHFGGERRNGQCLGEKPAVDVWKRGDRFIEVGKPVFAVERVEKRGELRSQIMTVA